MPPEKPAKKKIRWSAARAEAFALVWARRWRLTLGLGLVAINTLSGLVLPLSARTFIDEVVGKGHLELLGTLALRVGIATIISAVTSFAQSQVLGVAAQKAITDMRRRVEEHILRLPVRYFDKTQSGVLISRIMTDPEGIRNLVGTGLVQLVSSSVTAIICMGILLYINWSLTLIILVVLGGFGAVMSYAFKTLRPLFRDRGKINAEVTGRLNQALGGVRIVKTYTAEKREDLVFTEGVHGLLRNVAKSMTGVSGIGSISAVVVGVVGIVTYVIGGRAIVAGRMTTGQLLEYIALTAYMTVPIIQLASIGTQIT